MAESSSSSGFAYRAFISYSHRDRAWGDWLHKTLETYRVPARLVGKVTAHGAIPRRLNPIFRDREEFASATDLGRKVNSALGQSENLIVICSPASATSHWVNEEVLAYKRKGRAERIFCLIVDGEPNASTLPGHEAEECFCPALRFTADSNGRPTAEPVEPIAADARPGKDGKGNAKLKLVAGMLDVGFDALKQREQRRQLQRMTAITAMAVCVMAVTIVLAIAALIARQDAVISQRKAVTAERAAERRQKQAEGLVGFMLGNLSDKLEQVHRLDIMQAVDDKAMAYFNSLPAADATDAALLLRVNALIKIGGTRLDQGQGSESLQSYRAASALAAQLMQRSPGDIARQIAYADSLKWLGQAYWYQGDLTQALGNFQTANVLLQKAHAAKPRDNDLAFDLAASRSNAGHVLEIRGDLALAQIEYEATLKLYRSLVASDPSNPKWQSYLGDGWNNLGKLALERGLLDQAVTAYSADQRIKARLAASDARNHDAQENLLLSDAILGRTLAICGDSDSALHYTGAAVQLARALANFDPSNLGFQEDLALYDSQLGGLQRQVGQASQAAASNAAALQAFASLTTKSPTETDYQKEFAQAQLESSRLQLSRHELAAAGNLTTSALAIIQKLRANAPDDRGALLLAAQAHLQTGNVAASRNDIASAQREWTRALDLLRPALSAGNDPNFMAAYTEALLRLDRSDAAQPVIAKLNAMGYRTPDFTALLSNRHLDYPVNAAFKKNVAQIVQGNSAPNVLTGATRLAAGRH